MQRLKQIIEQSDTAAGRAFDLFIQALIIISLIAFSIETMPDLAPETRLWLARLEIAIVIIFTIEYLLRVLVATPKRAYIFSFYGLIDLLAILPFYLTLGLTMRVDLRSLRALRLLRLFRIFKLVRYSHAIRRFHIALRLAWEEIVLFLATASILLYLAAVGIYYFENRAQPDDFSSVFESLWWAIATLTTVGYGDVYPITTGGRIFTAFVLVIGLGVVSVPAGLVASALGKARELEAAEASKTSSVIE